MQERLDSQMTMPDLQIIPIIITAITAALTAGFVGLLFIQTRRQKKEHDLTIRPIIVDDRSRADGSIQFVSSKEDGCIEIRLVNVGNIPTAKTRITLLPLDKYSGFLTRERALKKYLRKIGKDKLKSTNSCIMLRPIRERIKRTSEQGSFENYLIVGDDFKKIKPIVDEFDAILDKIGTKEKRKEFDDAGRARAESMAKLSPKDWDKFYLTGDKRGDLLDRTGPVDWEVFDSDMGKDKIRKILGDFADEVYATAPDRARIINEMSKEDRKQYDEAIEKRLEAWEMFPPEIAEEFAVTSMNLRKVYKDIKDIKSTVTNMLAPKHPIELSIHLNEKDLKDIESGEYMYFGVLVQYSRPGGKGTEYTYYMQGYVDKNEIHLDRSLDTL